MKEKLKELKCPICMECEKEIPPDGYIRFIGKFEDERNGIKRLYPMCDKCYRSHVWFG